MIDEPVFLTQEDIDLFWAGQISCPVQHAIRRTFQPDTVRFVSPYGFEVNEKMLWTVDPDGAQIVDAILKFKQWAHCKDFFRLGPMMKRFWHALDLEPQRFSVWF